MVWYERVRDHYREPHRSYHTLTHIRECLKIFDELPAVRLTGDPDAVELALWLHDVVYDPRGQDNEQHSGAFAEQLLRDLGCTKKTVAQVRRLIVATRHEALPHSYEGKLVCDIDLAILGADPKRYSQYARQIRREYSWVPLDRYREGRASFLERFLARPKIYQTPELAHLERRARENLARELVLLSDSF
jgi:predicted metal-dependent HD superfamily phosphohydrolase